MTDRARQMRRAAVAHTLRQCRLFAGLDSDEIAAIADLVELRRLEKEAMLFREGDPAEGFYVVHRGAINVHRSGPGGREQVIHVFGPGESFAEAVVAEDAGFPADARAVGSAEVLVVPRSAFLALIARRPRLALAMLASMAGHLRLLVSRLEDLTQKDVETRFAAWLWRQSDQGRLSEVEVEGTKRMLAAELGTTSETLSRTLARFAAMGIVRVAGRRIRIHDVRLLKDRAQAKPLGRCPRGA